MKALKTLLLTLLLLPLLTASAHAQDIYREAAEATGVYAMEDLDSETRAVSGALEPDGSYDVGEALDRLWAKLRESLALELQSSMSFAAGLVAIALLCALAGSLCSSESIRDYINLSACCAAAVSLLGGMDGIVSQTVDSLNKLSDYSKAALPALFTAAAACGAVSSSAAKYAAVCIAMDVLMSTAQRVVIPLVYAFIAIALANSLFPNAILANMSRLTKWLAGIIMTGLTIAFSGYIGMTGLVTGSVDAVAVKTAKTVISTALPVVGGIISDASSVVLSAAQVIKSSAGVFGLIAVCALCAGPFAMLSVKMLILRAAAAVSDTIPNGKLSGLISDVSTAMGLLLGLLGCCGIMLFISLMSGMKVVTS